MVLLFIFCLLCSCSSSRIEWSNIKEVMYKQDVNCAKGQLAAVYDNKIFFAGNVNNEYGIYSMDLDGRNIQLEFTSNKIIKLFVTEEKFYYISLNNKRNTKEGIYSLYIYDRESDEVVLLAGDGLNQSVENMMIANDTILVRMIESLHSSKAPNSYMYYISDFNDLTVADEILLGFNDSNEYKLLIYDDYIITFVEYKYLQYPGKEIEFDENDSVYNFETNENLMWQHLDGENCDFKVVHTDNDSIYLAYKNNLVIYDKNTLTEKNKVFFQGMSNEYQLDYLIKKENIIYLIFLSDDDQVELYIMNSKSLNYTELKTFDDKSILLNFQVDCVIYAEEDKIICQEVGEDGLGDIEYELEFNDNIVQNCLFEVVGNWVFIYDKGKPNNQSPFELVYRVNLKTKEIFKN